MGEDRSFTTTNSKFFQDMKTGGRKFLHAPFGSQSNRFPAKGFHPGFNKAPSSQGIEKVYSQTKQNKKITQLEEMPSAKTQLTQENSKMTDEQIKEKRKKMIQILEKRISEKRKRLLKALKQQQKQQVPGNDWKRTLSLERWAQIPYVLNYDRYQMEKLRKAYLGPGRYYRYDLYKPIKCSNIPGVMAAKVPRFIIPGRKESTTPGPGTYGQGGIPSARAEKKKIFGKHTSMQMSLGHSYREKSGSGLGPTTYQRSKAPIDAYLQKVVGIRGPYDTFTGSRMDPIKSGHLAAKEQYNYLTPYIPPSILEERMADKHRGKFLLSNHSSRPTGRFIIEDFSNEWSKQNAAVGPGTYSPKQMQKCFHAKGISFNSNTPRFHALYVRRFTRDYHHCGPGRYYVEKKKTLSKLKDLVKAIASEKREG